MTSLESHGHSSGHADAETLLAPEIVAEPGGPLSAAAPFFQPARRPGLRAAVRAAICEHGSALTAPELIHHALARATAK